MSDQRSEPEGTQTQAPTCGEGAAWGQISSDLRVHGLTVLWHPDPARVGERALLEGLDARRHSELSRQTPEFAAPGSSSCGRPLADLRLSRTPILLRPSGDGGVRIERGDSPMLLTVDGPDAGSGASGETGASGNTGATGATGDISEVVVSASAIEEGVVLCLARRVVLLLHRLDPIADTTTPRFDLVGESSAMAQVRRDIVQTADLKVPILLRGESGTGKELVARAIHDAGPRRHGPYVAVNMAALPPSLAAAELFGAERGAFTGAERKRAGHFEQAHGGTLFLDEVGETPPEVQALLLRTLETGEVRAVGGSRTMTPDVRIVSATDSDLEAAIDGGRFRAPLLYRLGGYVLRLPPLRRRREDFGRLFRHFLQRELEVVGQSHRLTPRPCSWLPAPLVARLAAWSWPGNVRQLANVARQLVIANRDADPATRFDELETLLGASSKAAAASAGPQAASSSAPVSKRAGDLLEEQVVAALRAHGFRPSAAADALGISRSSIYDWIERIPGLRKASELTREEIEDARTRVGPSLEAVAADLEVSLRALRRRLGQLESG